MTTSALINKSKFICWDYNIIWFFELDPNSLCGKTIAFKTTTSPGIVTLLPENEQTLLFFFFKKIRFYLPMTVIDGWSFPSWNNESCSILENCLFGSGSTIVHLISLHR